MSKEHPDQTASVGVWVCSVWHSDRKSNRVNILNKYGDVPVKKKNEKWPLHQVILNRM